MINLKSMPNMLSDPFCLCVLPLFLFFWVWTPGVWGDLASHKRLFNPPPQFSRLGTWCPALMSCMNACEYVFMYVVYIISGDGVLGD